MKKNKIKKCIHENTETIAIGGTDETITICMIAEWRFKSGTGYCENRV
ncbi:MULTISPECIES: hypothetical protein [Gracilibacillus]